MAIGMENGIDKLNLNFGQGCLHSLHTNAIVKGMKPFFSLYLYVN